MRKDVPFQTTLPCLYSYSSQNVEHTNIRLVHIVLINDCLLVTELGKNQWWWMVGGGHIVNCEPEQIVDQIFSELSMNCSAFIKAVWTCVMSVTVSCILFLSLGFIFD